MGSALFSGNLNAWIELVCDLKGEGAANENRNYAPPFRPA